MPVIISFDIANARPEDQNRIQSFFERLGWENIGGSSYRYPTFSHHVQTEDWFNNVVPALMLLRCFLLKNAGVTLTKLSLDAQSSTGYNAANDFGDPPLPGTSIKLSSTKMKTFGEKNLMQWLEGKGLTYPYDVEPRKP